MACVGLARPDQGLGIGHWTSSRIHREALPERGFLPTGAVRFVVCELCTTQWRFLAFPSAIQHTRLGSYGGVTPALKRAIGLEPLATGRAVEVTIDKRLAACFASHCKFPLSSPMRRIFSRQAGILPIPIFAEAFPQGSMKK